MMSSFDMVPKLERRRAARALNRRFTVERMVRDYVKVYERFIEGKNLLTEFPGSNDAGSDADGKGRSLNRSSIVKRHSSTEVWRLQDVIAKPRLCSLFVARDAYLVTGIHHSSHVSRQSGFWRKGGSRHTSIRELKAAPHFFTNDG